MPKPHTASDPGLPPAIGKPATRALAAAGFTRVEELARLSEAELLGLHGVGPKAGRILKAELEARGLAFRGGRRVVHKAFACVVRGEELLVFDHPEAGVQIPKGSMEPGEEAEAAARRELLEEAGVADVRVALRLPVVHVQAAGGDPAGPPQDQRWHLFVFAPTAPLPERWAHVVGGDGADAGMAWSYRWIPLATAEAVLHPHFAPAARALQAALAGPPEGPP